MPTDSAGNYSLPPGYLAVAGTTIRAEQHNAPLQDVAQGLSDRLMRDGRNGMVGDLDMGTFRIRNLAPGRSATDALTVGQGVPLGTIVDFAGVNAPSGWMLCFGQEVSRADYLELFTAIGTAWGSGNGATTFNLPNLRGATTAGRDNMGGTDAGRLSGFYGTAARTLAAFLGSASHVLTTGQMPSHNHGGATGIAGQHSHGGSTAGGGLHQHSGNTDAGGLHTHEYTYRGGAGPLGGVDAGGLSGTVTSQTAPAGNHAHSFTTFAAGEHQHGISADGNHQHAINGQGNNEAHPNAQPTVIVNKIIKVSV